MAQELRNLQLPEETQIKILAKFIHVIKNSYLFCEFQEEPDLAPENVDSDVAEKIMKDLEGLLKPLPPRQQQQISDSVQTTISKQVQAPERKNSEKVFLQITKSIKKKLR